MFGLPTKAFGQRSAQSSLWREWATIENQWQVEKRSLMLDRKQFAAKQRKEKPRPAPKKKKAK
jgi:hypothetical protein